MRLGIASRSNAVTNLAWTKLAPATTPAKRYVYGMCTDANGDVIMLAGDTLSGTNPLADFYRYTEPSGTPTWTAISTTHTPWGLISAAGLRDTQIRLDPVTNLVIARAGDTTAAGGGVTNTWAYNSTGSTINGIAANDWGLLSPTHSPTATAEYAIDFDPVTGHIIVNGGFANIQEQFSWSGSDWIVFSGIKPPGRSGHAMCLDPSRGYTVMFGGHTDTVYDVLLNDTWTWNGTAWTQQSPTTVPAARTWHTLTYMPQLKMVVLYGGFNTINSLNDAWGWNGSNWVKISQDSLADSFSNGAQLIYSNKLGKAIGFGGLPAGSSNAANGSGPVTNTWALIAQSPAAGMTPVQFATTAATASPIVVPFSPTDGNTAFLTAKVTLHKASGDTATVSTPANWTKLSSGGTGGSPFLAYFVYPKPPPGTSSVSFTVTNSPGSVLAGVVVTEFRGQRVTGVADGPTLVGSGASGQTATATGVLPGATGEFAEVVVATDGGAVGNVSGSSTIPTGWNCSGAQYDPDTSDGEMLVAYWRVGTASAPSALLSWLNGTGNNHAFTTYITSVT